jgi:hypothetical protein
MFGQHGNLSHRNLYGWGGGVESIFEAQHPFFCSVALTSKTTSNMAPWWQSILLLGLLAAGTHLVSKTIGSVMKQQGPWVLTGVH